MNEYSLYLNNTSPPDTTDWVPFYYENPLNLGHTEFETKRGWIHKSQAWNFIKLRYPTVNDE